MEKESGQSMILVDAAAAIVRFRRAALLVFLVLFVPLSAYFLTREDPKPQYTVDERFILYPIPAALQSETRISLFHFIDNELENVSFVAQCYRQVFPEIAESMSDEAFSEYVADSIIDVSLKWSIDESSQVFFIRFSHANKDKAETFVNVLADGLRENILERSGDSLLLARDRLHAFLNAAERPRTDAVVSPETAVSGTGLEAVANARYTLEAVYQAAESPDFPWKQIGSNTRIVYANGGRGTLFLVLLSGVAALVIAIGTAFVLAYIESISQDPEVRRKMKAAVSRSRARRAGGRKNGGDSA